MKKFNWFKSPARVVGEHYLRCLIELMTGLDFDIRDIDRIIDKGTPKDFRHIGKAYFDRATYFPKVNIDTEPRG